VIIAKIHVFVLWFRLNENHPPEPDFSSGTKGTFFCSSSSVETRGFQPLFAVTRFSLARG